MKAVITQILKKNLNDIKHTREISLNLQELRNPNLIIFEGRKGITRDTFALLFFKKSIFK